jgi:hypothetical protein
LLALTVAHARGHRPRKAAPKKPFPSKIRLTKVESCDVPEAKKKVMVLKQWHLAPTTVTKGFKEKYPQEKNQTAIYKVLEEGVKRGELQLIVSEGCEGEINDQFTPAFNGWDYTSLKEQSARRNYERILTLVPLKIEAKYGGKIETFCGDSEKLIQEGNLRLSNLRGWMGFYARLSDKSEAPDKLKIISESAADLLKLPKDTPVDKLIAEIKVRIQQELDGYFKSLAERNDAFVKVLSEHEFERAAVVIGGLHAPDLKEKLQKAGLGCDIYEPPGYQRNDEKLVQDFQKIR